VTARIAALERGVRAPAALVRALAVSRPLFWLNSATLCVIAVMLSPRAPGWRELVLVAFATFPLNLLVYALNDLHDFASDSHNPRKGSAEGARADRSALRELVMLALAANVPFVAFFVATAPAPRALVVLAALYVVAWAYSAPPIRAKSRPGWDSLANAGYVLPLVFACLYLEVPDPPWLETSAFAVWTIGAHAFTSIQDVAADRAGGVRTIATALGARASAAVALACYALSGALLAARHPLFAGVLVLHAAIVVRMLGARDEEAPHRAYRLFMALNVATGFAVTTTVALAHPARTRWAAAVMLSLCALVALATLAARRDAGAAR
jgi:4-hydroxybenzoate polyprenyltransferase